MKSRLRDALPGTRPLRLAAAAALVLLSACVSHGPSGVPAGAERTASILRAWDAFRASVVSRSAEELFYDVSARRSVVSGSFGAAVRCEPGRSLTVVLEGPLGAPLGRARWDGTRTVVERGGKTTEGDAALAVLGIPLPPRALSTLLFGLPETSAPDRVTLAGAAIWLAWRGDDVACAFDPTAPRVDRVVSRAGGPRVEILYSGWENGTPTRIRIDVERGGRAELVLRRAVEARDASSPVAPRESPRHGACLIGRAAEAAA